MLYLMVSNLEFDNVEDTIQTILRFGMLLFRGYSSGHIGSDLWMVQDTNRRLLLGPMILGCTRPRILQLYNRAVQGGNGSNRTGH
jgi:hypothetical protein